jgi:hypothetical protein
LTPRLILGSAAAYRWDIGAQFRRLRHCAKIFILTRFEVQQKIVAA